MLIEIFMVITIQQRISYTQVKVPMPSLEVCAATVVSTIQANKKVSMLEKVECTAEVKSK